MLLKVGNSLVERYCPLKANQHGCATRRAGRVKKKALELACVASVNVTRPAVTGWLVPQESTISVTLASSLFWIISSDVLRLQLVALGTFMLQGLLPTAAHGHSVDDRGKILQSCMMVIILLPRQWPGDLTRHQELIRLLLCYELMTRRFSIVASIQKLKERLFIYI